MSFTYESEFVFIGRGDESFLENYSYELSDDPGCKGGKIFMALEILNNQAEAEDIGEAIFTNFKQKFYESVNEDVYVRFEEALKAANGVIETLKEEKVSRFIGNLNISIGAIADETLYISSTGDADVYLVRKRFVSVVSEGLAEDSKKDAFINIANGTLEPFDRVIFSSTRLLRYITKGELGRVFTEGGSSAKIGDQLVQLQDFIMTEILGRSAVIGISVGVVLDEASEQMFAEEGEGIFVKFFKKWLSAHERNGCATSKFSLAEKLPLLKEIVLKIASIIPKKLELPKPESKLPKIEFHKHMSKGRILVLVILLLVLLVSGTLWLRTRSDQKQFIAEQQVKLNHVRELMNEASTTGQFDKSKASELLLSGEKETLEVLNSKFLRSEAVKMLDDIQKQRDMLDDVRRISAPNVLADFSTKRSNVSALGLLSLKDRLYGFEYNALYEMVLDKLQDPLTISDLETIILGTAFPEQNSLLFLTRTGKMIEYAASRFSAVTTKDGIWKKGVDIKFYNEKVYVLDPERNQIWRYKRLRDGFDAGNGYNQNADLSKGVALAIDSSIYVLNSDGYVIQLYQGQKQEYPLRRAPLVTMSSPTKLFTNADMNNLYILEPSKQRVIVFRKDPKNGGAQYTTQYVFEKTGVLRDLAVAENRLYVMDDKRVYYINLSGL